MTNKWADPAGFEKMPPRVRYRIREIVSPKDYSALFEGAMKRPMPEYELGPVVERTTHVKQVRGAWHHGLNSADALFFDLITVLIQKACGYFYLPEGEYVPLEGVPEVVVSDDEIRERIDRLNRGENQREAERTGKRSYPISELPWQQQRNLIEQVEWLKHDFGFEILGEVEE